MSKQKHAGERSSTNFGKRKRTGIEDVNRGSDGSVEGEGCNVL